MSSPLPDDTLARIKELLTKVVILPSGRMYDPTGKFDRAIRQAAPALISRLEVAEARATAAEAALDRYRYAIHWMAADSWDVEHSGGEARARCEWARGEDRGSNLDNDQIAIIGQTFLATTGRTRAALTANPKGPPQ